jgi:hypothetical protein
MLVLERRGDGNISTFAIVLCRGYGWQAISVF